MDAQFLKFHELLKCWNKHLNLTAIDDETGFAEKHLYDSLKILPHIKGATSLVDLGTGAGIPGIILKIARPEISVALIDSTRKKISFCDEAIRQLGLTGAQAIWGRAEDKKIYESLQKFDVVISRATWELKKFLPIAVNYLASNGKIIAMKGPRWEEELKNAEDEIKNLSLKITASEDYSLGDGSKRHLIIFQ